jgi:hypothetical protein
MAKSKEAAGRPRRKKDGLYIMVAEDRLVCVYCEVIQKIKNAENPLCVCKNCLEEWGRQEQVDNQKEARAKKTRK